MPAAFLHGAEVIEYTNGPVPIQVVKSAVIGLIGRAPMWAAAGAIPMWNSQEILAVGAYRVDSSGNLQQVSAITTGETGATAPGSWGSTVGASTTDSGVTWKCVALAGTAAMAAIAGAPAVNVPVLVSSQQAAAAFGPLVQGYDIPYALAAILAQGAGQVIVVNVFDQSKHVTAIANQAISMPASGPQVINLGHMGVSAVVVQNSGKTTTYVNGTDFTVDYVNGVITAKNGGALTTGEALNVSFNYADPTKNVAADVIGGVTGGVYTGISALLTTYGTMGFFAKILLAPNWSNTLSVAQALDSTAQKIRAMALVDSAAATPVATAISNRGLSTSAFDTSSKRTILCFPNQLFYDTGLVPTGVTLSAAGLPIQALANATSDGPYSMWVAGAIAAKDMNQGYWYSPSNTQISGLGVSGPDVTLYQSSLFDPNSDVNTLNSDGIVTVLNAFATGLRVWGNRSAAYPTYTTADVFICVRRTMDVIEESVELAMLQFIDQPISNALISSILASVNAFVRTLIQRGALVAGAASYNPAENPSTQIANGQLVFDLDITPPPPAERLTWNTYLDTTQLATLGTGGLAGVAAA